MKFEVQFPSISRLVPRSGIFGSSELHCKEENQGFDNENLNENKSFLMQTLMECIKLVVLQEIDFENQSPTILITILAILTLNFQMQERE